MIRRSQRPRVPLTCEDQARTRRLETASPPGVRTTPSHNGAEPRQDSATATHNQDFGGPDNVNGTVQQLCSA